jgi:hypothetical protein
VPVKTIPAAQFATAFDLKPNLVAWFLGAGASAASGIPTGDAMIRDLKAQIFCRGTKLSFHGCTLNGRYPANTGHSPSAAHAYQDGPEGAPAGFWRPSGIAVIPRN